MLSCQGVVLQRVHAGTMAMDRSALCMLWLAVEGRTAVNQRSSNLARGKRWTESHWDRATVGFTLCFSSASAHPTPHTVRPTHCAPLDSVRPSTLNTVHPSTLCAPQHSTLCAPQQGLEYLHYHKVVHGDLKPANLILDSNTRRVKIVDFGSSVLNTNRPGGTHGTGMTSMIAANVMGPGTMACTPGFRSPESLQPGYRLSFEVRRRSG